MALVGYRKNYFSQPGVRGLADVKHATSFSIKKKILKPYIFSDTWHFAWMPIVPRCDVYKNY